MGTSADDLYGHSTSYVKAFPYSDKRHFESPRVHIPPPNLDYQNGKPSFHVFSAPFEQSSSEYGNPSFLKALSAGHRLDMSHTMLSWKYEMRRTAQPILPFLLLGPSSAARDREFVKNTGITLMVAVRSVRAVIARPTFLHPATFPSSEGISTLTFDFEFPHDFIPKLRPVIRSINDHLETTCAQTPVENVHDIRGKALIFCESGNDRSAVLVAAYLMVIYGVSAFSAIHVVQSQRFCITMSDDMKNVLLDLQEILKAERQVSSSNSAVRQFDSPVNQSQGSSSLIQRPMKRTIDDVYNSEEDLGHETLRGDNVDVREGVAPFTDILDLQRELR
ncbi:uncharacterized protein Z518_03706 [Rhinocladiella mackenziei CBS 650.93]|uniref:Tyrosine specific protein phosphatases domain-containing protein n=1 Tax=Rhinocladiella mackenziei CBS 650.93 TaxID=1442369 RepID=A0A0D2IJ17_9EURO|nr:uncharacterized protein Z518_03706 [Rhinocladiella mackenziei CBS 650.93]KIX05734.1 hypothetical protein Z518_03706 [Rhinocladiella mackenziei CBS 650.93]